MDFVKLYTKLSEVARKATKGEEDIVRGFVFTFAPALEAAHADKGRYIVDDKRAKNGKLEVNAVGLVRHAAVYNGQGPNFSMLVGVRARNPKAFRKYLRREWVSLRAAYIGGIVASTRKVRVPRAVRARMKAFESFAARNGLSVTITFRKLA